MTEQALDYTGHENTEMTSDALAKLADLANKQSQAELTVTEKENELKEANENLRQIAERDIPLLMSQLQLEEFKTSSGLKIKIMEKLRASITGERKPKAIAWLEDNGYANLVKNVFTIQFKREEEKEVKKFLADLRKRKKQLRVDQSSDVHNSTLCSFLSEQLEEGKDIPMDLFGVHIQKRSKITK